jgi:tetratricopeptide (TPR) repeat protein
MNIAKTEIPQKYKAFAARHDLKDCPFFDERPEHELLFMMGDTCKNRGDAEGMREAFTMLADHKDSTRSPEFHFRALFALCRYGEAISFFSGCRKAGKPLSHSLLWNPLGFFGALPPVYFETALKTLRKEHLPPQQRLAGMFYALFLQRCAGMPVSYSSLSAEKQLSSPEYAWLSAAIGYEYLQSCRYEDALEMLSAAAGSSSEDWILLCRLGETLFCLGRAGEALEKFAAARELAPGESDAWLGKITLFRGDADAALELLEPEDAENLVWRDSDAALWRGAARLMLRADGAEKLIAQACAANPSSVEAKLWHARALMQQGSLKPALEAAREACSVRNDYFWAHMLQARIQLELGNGDQALVSAASAKAAFAALLDYLERSIKPGGDPLSSKTALKKFVAKAFALAGANISVDQPLARLSFAGFDPLALAAPRRMAAAARSAQDAAIFADKNIPPEIAAAIKRRRLEHCEFVDNRPADRLLCACAEECMSRGDARGAKEFYSFLLKGEYKDLPAEDRFRALFFLRDFKAAFELAFPENGGGQVSSSVAREPLYGIAALPEDYLSAGVAALRKAELDERYSFVRDFYTRYLSGDAAGIVAMTDSKLDDAKKYGWINLVAGTCLLDCCQYKAAAQRFSSAGAICGKDHVTLCRLGEALLCSGQEKKAFAAFAEARALLAHESDAWKGEMLLFLGRYEDALHALEGPGSLAPTWRCAAWLRLGRMQDALDALAGLVRARASDREAGLWYAYALALSGEYAEASSAVGGVLEAVPDYFWAHIVAAAARADEKPRARRHLERAAALWPDVYAHLEKKIKKVSAREDIRGFALAALEFAGGNLRNDYYLQGLSLPGFFPSERALVKPRAR